MATIRELNKWANAHTNYPTDIVRIAFGAFLFFKGVSFITERRYFYEALDSMNGFGTEMLLVHYVALAHMVGGAMVIIGFLTRWSIGIQMPIFVFAFLINFIGDFNVSNFIQSSIAVIFGGLFLFYGSGKHSVDYYLKMEQ